MMPEKEYVQYLKRAQNFFQRLQGEFFADTRVMAASRAWSELPVPYADRLKGDFKPLAEGDCWGKLWESAWIHAEFAIPAEWAGAEIALKLNVGGEALLFDAEGVPEFSFTNTCIYSSQYRKEIYPLIARAAAGQKLDLWIEAAANGLFGDELNPAEPSQGCTLGIVESLRCGVFRREVWSLRLDVEVLLGSIAGRLFAEASTSPYRERGRRATQILMAINPAIDVYADNPDNAARARAELAGELALPATASAMEITAVGHAHIDTGWLWPVRETIRKCARTFSSQVKLLEEYPDYVFGASQAQHYWFVKHHYPELYAKIKKYVAEGRWEIQGGMWVEADCNVTSGESMVRQFLHGKNFFMDEFGFDVKNLWLPDVFGYSAAMPQIIRKSDCDYFLTQKISWSQFNKFPYHSFLWRGIDNTEVLTHFPPEDTYNTLLVPDQLNYGVDNYSEAPAVPEFLSLFGIGDGGGGPKAEYVERGLRVSDYEAAPKVKFGRADSFFASLSRYRDQLPTWVGELYLELHRGTLTTQSATKRNNRKCEEALAAAEFISSCLPAADYPAAELDHAWKTVLLNQFHDIIPGSSIREVYTVTEAEHAEVLATCRTLIERACAKLGCADPDAVTVVNTLSSAYANPVRLPDGWKGFAAETADGVQLATQSDADGVWILGSFPANSFTVLKKGAPLSSASAPTDRSLVLENALVRYEFDRSARLVRAFDKETRRDILAAGSQGNLLTLYVDIPNNWDAWDIDFFYENEAQETPAPVSAAVKSCGIVRRALAFELTIGKSAIRQEVVLPANSKRLEFHTEVDWKEDRRMLRVGFPTSVVTTAASFDIQYGLIKRPTHRNTSWDKARFEVAAHRYVDLSDHAFGVALLNDCKYGHKVSGNTLDLNLLRATAYPDYAADRGTHRFSYALLPHAGTLEESTVYAEAASFNRPPVIAAGVAMCEAVPPCRLIEAEGAALAVVKKAEKSDDTVIRLVETRGRTGIARLLCANPRAALVETNLVEWSEENTIQSEAGVVEIELAPFEIKTFFIR